MKIHCTPDRGSFDQLAGLNILLFGPRTGLSEGGAGCGISRVIQRKKLCPNQRAWDLMSLALSVVSADLASPRGRSPDGWTREFDLTVAVQDVDFWNTQVSTIQKYLAFLTTDIWRVRFSGNGYLHRAPHRPTFLPEEEVLLLSGGLDSLVGAIDFASGGRRALHVSHLVRGDGSKQRKFAAALGDPTHHLQMNHDANVPGQEATPTQRARSIAFLSYGVLAATTLGVYRDGAVVRLNACENGFIAINPPLTPLRLGSLSTRTMHPIGLSLFQQILDSADLKVQVENPYRLKTKGEMMVECLDQATLQSLGPKSTSCGRFLRYGGKHCGRCVPCLIRRAAFRKWGHQDTTYYVFDDLSIVDVNHAGYDDVRATLMAGLEVQEVGLDPWLGTTLCSPLIREVPLLKGVVERGLQEVNEFLSDCGVQ